MLENSLINKEIKLVQCPHCGMVFDYNSAEHNNYEHEVLDTIVRYRRWITEDVISQEMAKLEPSIRDRVVEIINSTDIANKSEDEIRNLEYAYCPKCYSHVFPNEIVKKSSENSENKPSNDTSSEAVENDTLDWETLRDALK